MDTLLEDEITLYKTVHTIRLNAPPGCTCVTNSWNDGHVINDAQGGIFALIPHCVLLETPTEWVFSRPSLRAIIIYVRKHAQ